MKRLGNSLVWALSGTLAIAYAPQSSAALPVHSVRDIEPESDVLDGLIIMAQVNQTNPNSTNNVTPGTSTNTTNNTTTNTDPASNTNTSVDTNTSAQKYSGESAKVRRTNLNWLITQSVNKDLAAANDECGRYDPEYRIDCLKTNIDNMLRKLPRSGDYREARQILQKASQRLGNIVNKYADPSKPRIKATPGANPRFKRVRHYRAVKRSALNSAMREARQVIQEAQTQLLRSAENSSLRRAHYQSISVAVGSTKVLLRSA